MTLQAPLSRFATPPALEDRSVHHPRPCLSRFVPPSPFLTTLAVCSALAPLEVSLEWHSWGSSLQGLPVLRCRSPLDVRLPSWRLPESSHLRGGSRQRLRCASRVFLAARPSPPTSGFPSVGVRTLLGFYFRNPPSTQIPGQALFTGGRQAPSRVSIGKEHQPSRGRLSVPIDGGNRRFRASSDARVSLMVSDSYGTFWFHFLRAGTYNGNRHLPRLPELLGFGLRREVCGLVHLIRRRRKRLN